MGVEALELQAGELSFNADAKYSGEHNGAGVSATQGAEQIVGTIARYEASTTGTAGSCEGALPIEFYIESNSAQRFDLMPDKRLYDTNPLWVKNDDLFLWLVDCVLQLTFKNHEFPPDRLLRLVLVQQPVGHCLLIEEWRSLIRNNIVRKPLHD